MKTASLETLSALLFGGERFLRRPPRPRPVLLSVAAVLYSFHTSLAMTETITEVDSVGRTRCMNSKMV